DLVAKLAERGGLAYARPERLDVLLGPRLHAFWHWFGGRIECLVSGHHTRKEVEHVALDDLAFGARTAQRSPVDVVLLCQTPGQRGDIGFAHGAPPKGGSGTSL